MGYKIIDKKDLAPAIYSLKIEAPLIAQKARPGNFVILRYKDSGERLPFTLVDWDQEEGWVELIIQEVGKSTKELALFKAGDEIKDLLGPLGKPYPLQKYEGPVVGVAGGLGAAPLYPILVALKKLGNEIITVSGARNTELFILKDEFREISKEFLIATDDGSEGRKGFVTDVLRDLLEGKKLGQVIAIGPVPMMAAVTRLTKEFNTPTVVSLNALMIDGTGMCGGCRVTVGGQTKFTCVDGPDFDAHQVDFDEISRRQRFYKEQEGKALKIYEDHVCNIQKAADRLEKKTNED
ncbi:MAG: sulfide/dihydroorotate dehydrogenase-like FAD/NAD-binding protein [Bacillota bacterium]